ncbi:MAG TPA: SpoIIE family protein phosphatase, partial [Armatimonadota bacterium]
MTSHVQKTSDKNDVGEQLRAQLQSRSVLLFVTLASIGDAVIVTDSDGDITFLNPAAESLTGWGLQDAVGLKVEEVFRLVTEGAGGEVASPVRQALDTVTKVRLPADVLLVRKDETRVPIDDSASPIIGAENEVLGVMLVFRDITERKNAEREIRYRSELDRMVARISRTFITSPVADVDDRIDDAVQDIGRFVDADRAYVFLYDEIGAAMTCTHEWCAEGVPPLKGIGIPTSAVPQWTLRILERHHVRIAGAESAPPEAMSERGAWQQQEVKALLAVPMAQEDRVLGFIGIESLREATRWPEEVINMLYLVGNVCASAMGRRDAQRKLDAAREREVEIGARIQQTLLLSAPPTASADFEVAAVTIPSRRIDGDFYDFILYPNRSLDVIFGDVMGKGVPAALLSAGAKTEFLRILSHLLVTSSRGDIPKPADIVNGVHGVVTPQLLNLDSFVTLSYVRFDPHANTITEVDCGHTRLLKCRWSDGTIERLSGFNMPLGFSTTEVYDQAQYSYEQGDVFLLYSDGVTEARSPRGDFFGTKRLENLLSEKYRLPAQSIVDEIRTAVTGFAETDELADDLTCVCLKISPGFENRPPPSIAELQVTSSLGELVAVRAFLRGFCEQRRTCGLVGKEFSMLELAVNEAASNIMRHAYHRRSDQQIWVRLSQKGDELTVRLSHTGEPFKHTGEITTPSLETAREGGWGLFIISHAVD